MALDQMSNQETNEQLSTNEITSGITNATPDDLNDYSNWIDASKKTLEPPIWEPELSKTFGLQIEDCKKATDNIAKYGLTNCTIIKTRINKLLSDADKTTGRLIRDNERKNVVYKNLTDEDSLNNAEDSKKNWMTSKHNRVIAKYTLSSKLLNIRANALTRSIKEFDKYIENFENNGENETNENLKKIYEKAAIKHSDGTPSDADIIIQNLSEIKWELENRLERVLFEKAITEFQEVGGTLRKLSDSPDFVSTKYKMVVATDLLLASAWVPEAEKTKKWDDYKRFILSFLLSTVDQKRDGKISANAYINSKWAAESFLKAMKWEKIDETDFKIISKWIDWLYNVKGSMDQERKQILNKLKKVCVKYMEENPTENVTYTINGKRVTTTNMIIKSTIPEYSDNQKISEIMSLPENTLEKMFWADKVDVIARLHLIAKLNWEPNGFNVKKREKEGEEKKNK